MTNDIAKQIAALSTRMDARFDSMGERIDRMDVRMEQGFTTVNERFEAMDSRISGLDARIDEVETSLGARIDGVETRLGKRIDSLDERIDGVETSLGARIDSLDERIGGLDERLGAVELKLELYKEKFFAPALQALGEGFAGLGERLDRLTVESRDRAQRAEREFTPIGAHRALDHRVAKLEQAGTKRGN